MPNRLVEIIKTSLEDYNEGQEGYDEDTLYCIDGGDCLLWKNPSPTSSMNATTITLCKSAQPYRYLKILVESYYSANYGIKVFTFNLSTVSTTANNGLYLWEIVPGNTLSSAYTYERRLQLVSDWTTVIVDQATYQTLSGSSTVSNNYMIPFEIWGSNNP